MKKKHTIKYNKLKFNKLKLKDLKTFYLNYIKAGTNKTMTDFKKEYINILKALYFYNKVHEKEYIKAKKYKEAIEKITDLNIPIKSSNDIKNISGIGKAMIDKLDELIKTGKVENLEKLKEKYGTDLYNKELLDNDIKHIFMNIYGIGEKKADELIEKGINTLEKLVEKQNEKQENDLPLLNDKQKIGLKYYKDLLLRIPRIEIEEYEKIFNKIFEKSQKDLNINDAKYEIVGSYRRGNLTSGDIDVIITSKSNNNKIFNVFLDNLIKENILIEILSRGSIKSLTIGKLNSKSTPRRLDFLYSPPNEYPFAILYFTGSKEFNTAMRQHALNNDLTLNEHGFHILKNKKKTDKLDVIFETEKDIFDYLNMEYKEPSERIDDNSVIIKSQPDISNKNKKTLKNIKNDDLIFNNFDKFKSEGIDSLKSMSSDELNQMLIYAINMYYGDNTKPILTDNQYDILREYILDKYPNNHIAKNHQEAIQIDSNNKIKLPYQMWSMDKIKPDTNELHKFKIKYKGPFVISTKLDGVSALFSTENNKIELYTRGNGIEGQTISHLIPYLKLPNDTNISIRGELIMKKNIFNTKYSDIYANSRNLVAGIINRKKISSKDIDIIKNIDFVAYEVIKPDNLKPSEQFQFLDKLNIINVKYEINILSDELTNEYLSNKLINWRENYDYLIDGIIFGDDNVYPRINKNPEHMKAFKMVLTEQTAESKVLDVIWTPSKDGFLKPRIRIEPVNIGGVIVTYITGNNAKFICDNNIGLGAIISIIRSGDVIPKVVKIIEPAPEPLMPTDKYIWNDTKVDILLIDKDKDESVIMKNILGFFKTLEISGLGEGNIKKIIKAGGNTIAKILGFTIDDFKKVDGFGNKTAEKIYNNIQKTLKTSTISQLAAASNVFPRGIGIQKIQLVLNSNIDIFNTNISDIDKLKLVKNIEGFADKTAKLFISGIPKFIEFIKDAKLEHKLLNETKIETINTINDNPIKNKKIVLSDIKGKNTIKQKITELGGINQDTITKDTNILVMGSLENETTKMQKAKKHNITIMSLDEFNKLINI